MSLGKKVKGCEAATNGHIWAAIRGDLVMLKMKANFDTDGHFGFQFGRDTSKHITIDNAIKTRPMAQRAVFLPAKEVLSLLGVILKSRDDDRSFGFDDTYVDLARILSQPSLGGRNFDAFAKARRELAKQLGERLSLMNN